MDARIVELGEVYEQQRGRLQRLVNRIVRNYAVAEDLIQDTFVKLNGRANATDSALLAATAKNLARDYLRGQKIRLSYAGDQSSLTPSSAEPLADQALESRQELSLFFEALQALPERTQRILLLSRLDGLTHPKIAKALGVSVSTVEKDMVQAILFCRAWQEERDRG